MVYEEMTRQLADYNWDDGFALPEQIVSDQNCDLAMALEVFYLGDGYAYLQEYGHYSGKMQEWFGFIHSLYQDILNGRYSRTEHRYEIPLSKVQRYLLAKNNIPEVFLTDV